MCTSFCLNTCFHFSWVISGSGIAGSYGNSLFSLLRNCQTFTKWRHHFIFPLAMYEGPNFSPSLTALVIVHLLHCSHPSGCKVVPHCGSFSWYQLMLSIFSFVYWSFVYLPWINVYLDPLLVFFFLTSLLKYNCFTMVC